MLQIQSMLEKEKKWKGKERPYCENKSVICQRWKRRRDCSLQNPVIINVGLVTPQRLVVPVVTTGIIHIIIVVITISVLLLQVDCIVNAYQTQHHYQPHYQQQKQKQKQQNHNHPLQLSSARLLDNFLSTTSSSSSSKGHYYPSKFAVNIQKGTTEFTTDYTSDDTDNESYDEDVDNNIDDYNDDADNNNNNDNGIFEFDTYHRSETIEEFETINNNKNDLLKSSIDLHPIKKKSICITGVVPKSGPLNEAVVTVLSSATNKQQQTQTQTQTHVQISLEEANQLIEIGAVWAKMESLSETELLDLYNTDNPADVGSNSRAMYADIGPRKKSQIRSSNNNKNDDHDDDHHTIELDDYIEQMTNQRFRRILAPSWIDAGTDLRIYPYPRRFTKACYEMSNRSRLLYEDTTFIVVDKPPMLPTQPDASNYDECCPGCVDKFLGPFYDINDNIVLNRPYICHRVDSCVGGCVVLSKNNNGQKVFQKYQRERAIRKMYLAITTNPVPLGIHIHWMWSSQSVRGKIGGPPCQLLSCTTPESKRKARENWKRCVLEVTECIPINIYDPTTNTSIEQKQSSHQQYYQSTIRLVTGRKHQVRAQLAALNCPILHDTLYGPIAGLTLDLIERSPEAETAMDVALTTKCFVPIQPIGLQAAGILFGGIRARANPPWWAVRGEKWT